MAEQEQYLASLLPENNTAYSKANLSKLFKALHHLDFQIFYAEEQATPDMTVKVYGGRFFVNGIYKEFSLDANKDVTTTTSPSFTAPTSNPRIDLLYYDTVTPGLGITVGAEAASPSAPAIPDPQMKIAIALIYHRVGTVKILNNDDAANSYLMGRNVRPFVTIGGGASNTLDGISNPGGDIDFKSPNGTMRITPDDGANDIDFEVLFNKGADVASAAALPLLDDGHYNKVTGTTAITSFDTVGVGTLKILEFNDVLTLTHHATNLILPGGVNITTSAKDKFIFIEYGVGTWKMVGGFPVLSNATPQPIGTASAGTGMPVSRGDHVHAVGAATIDQSMLKTSTSSGSTISDTPQSFTMTGGEYSFYPQVKKDSGATDADYFISTSGLGQTTSYLTTIVIDKIAGGGSTYWQNRYVTASGKEHWIFILYDKILNKIVAMSEATDHPSYGNGDDPDVIPHPFADYYHKPLPANLEIILVDIDTTNEVKAKMTRQRGILEIIAGDYDIDMAKPVAFKARDMDGKRTLKTKHTAYNVRALKPK